MTIQPPPPPSITPQQMNLLRIVASMAWSDGNLESEEVDLMLERFSRLFAQEPARQQAVQQELRNYVEQNIPLEELAPKLASPQERELVLRLGSEVIGSSSRTPDEPKVNSEEAAAYQRLVQLLGLPSEVVQRIEAEVGAELGDRGGLVDVLVIKIQQFIQG